MTLLLERGDNIADEATLLPILRWVLEHRVTKEVELLRAELVQRSLVVLDYETNVAVEDLSRSLSHAALLKYYSDYNRSITPASKKIICAVWRGLLPSPRPRPQVSPQE